MCCRLEDEEHDVQKEYSRLPKKAVSCCYIPQQLLLVLSCSQELEEKTRRITDEIEQLLNETDTVCYSRQQQHDMVVLCVCVCREE